MPNPSGAKSAFFTRGMGGPFPVASISAAIYLLAEGDSITAHTTPVSYARVFAGYKLARYWLNNTAVSSSTLNSSAPTLTSRASTDDTYAALSTNTIFTCLIGRNDYAASVSTATFLSDYATYLAARRSAGFDKIVIGTILPSTQATIGGTSFEPWRNTINTTLRTWAGSTVDAVFDFAADPTMGVLAAASDTNLYSDGTHPTTLGHQLLEPIYRAAVNPLYPP